jgi:D-alanine-D-alanine ligase
VTDAALSFRFELLPSDRAAVERMVRATSFFSEEEVHIALELVDERTARGDASGYFFVFAESGAAVVGYACYGPIPATSGSHDLYWVVVDPAEQQRGIGAALVAQVETAARQAGGERLWVDTSARPQYAPTRRFYERTGFTLATVLEDFYAPGDGKAIFVKRWS